MVALRNTRQVPSRSKPGVMHTQWFDGTGAMIGCTCDEAKAVHVPKYNFMPCGHMREWNAITTVDAAPHIEDDLRGSCCCCGRETKAIICFRCLGI